MSSFIAELRKPSITNQPPTELEILRSDLATIGWFLIMLILAFALRNGALDSQTQVSLPEELPSIAIPKDWVQGSSDDLAFYASDPASPSQFNSGIQVYTRPANADEDLALLRPAWGMARSQELDRYRELDATEVTVLDGVPGVIVTYVYVADPARPVGAAAPPVVVQASDLIFVTEGNVVVVTVAADATVWDEVQNDFRIIYDSLKVVEAEEVEEAIE